jgi:hypothetical protein
MHRLENPVCICYCGLCIWSSDYKINRVVTWPWFVNTECEHLNNSTCDNFVDRIYPIEPEEKDTTDTDRFASYIDIHLEIYSEGRLRTKLYYKRDDFHFPFWTFQLYIATFQQHLYMELYLSVDTIFQGLW